MMKRYLALLSLLAIGAVASAAYSPNTIITDPAGVNQATVKAASTAPVATDKALVVGISPNSPGIGRSWSLGFSGDSVTSYQGGTWSLGRTWNLSSGSDSVAATQSGNWSLRLQDGSGNSINSINNALQIVSGAAISASGSLTSTGTLLSQDCSQYQSVSVHVTSIGTGNTINFQVSNDNTNWFNAAMMPAGDLTSILTTSATAVGGYTTQLNSRYFRIQVTAYGSGTISANAYFKTFGNAPSSVGGYLSAQTLDGSGNSISSTSNALWVAQQGALPAGSAIIGKVGIDQTTPGTTNGVQINAALPTGSNTIGAVTQASGPWTQNITQFGGSNVVTGTGASGAGIPRVTVSNDSVLSSITNAVSTKAPVNANATLSARQTVSTSETNLAAPANAVCVSFESESGNLDNLRWGFSNSTTAILSSTLGTLMEPGRSVGDGGCYAVGAGTYLHMIATGSVSTDYMDVQWVLSQ